MSAGLRTIFALGVWLLLPATIGFFWDRSPRNDSREAVIQLENRWLQAQDDPKTLRSILSDDFVHVMSDGMVTKEEQLRYVEGSARVQREKRHFEDLRVRIFGSAAIATGIVVAESEAGKIRRTLFTDIFIYRGGRWQDVNAQETPAAASANR